MPCCYGGVCVASIRCDGATVTSNCWPVSSRPIRRSGILHQRCVRTCVRASQRRDVCFRPRTGLRLLTPCWYHRIAPRWLTVHPWLPIHPSIHPSIHPFDAQFLPPLPGTEIHKPATDPTVIATRLRTLTQYLQQLLAEDSWRGSPCFMQLYVR